MDFFLNHLYPNPLPQIHSLDVKFCTQEITNDILQMNKAASPGPDGFGLGFYKKCWSIVKPAFEHLFARFFDHQLDTASLNWALMVLIPKKDGARTPDACHPISLQNCPVKAIGKVLTNRLKPLIPLLVSNQTGFMSGRSISENFLFTTDLLNCCHKSRSPTLVVKLDSQLRITAYHTSHKGLPC